ncbi:PREDICTED: pumilio homolog 15-like [Nelumbo nucifera]|uniref:S-protein homolog n=2 Tax=Nelumbo nucifera TaxID=4432 RepID=A0A822Y030_NELNU|nr:PREDICTED: pumilio homolog 15-like [Nelumbo nucifera]DAD24606.1 TPA_asm: hypothetical protein HUJ06_026070 [Nelumbo nucifera]
MKISNAYVFMYALVLVLWLSEAERHVRVANDLGQGLNLTIHCRSHNDDLGLKELPYGFYFEWAFNSNIWGSTVFYCDMGWQQGSGHYDVFVARRDNSRCHYRCWWVARQDGLYALDEQHNVYNFWFPWNKTAPGVLL